MVIGKSIKSLRNMGLRTMHVGARFVILIVTMSYGYIDMQTDIMTKIRFHAVLFFAIAVGYFCIAVSTT